METQTTALNTLAFFLSIFITFFFRQSTKCTQSHSQFDVLNTTMTMTRENRFLIDDDSAQLIS